MTQPAKHPVLHRAVVVASLVGFALLPGCGSLREGASEQRPRLASPQDVPFYPAGNGEAFDFDMPLAGGVEVQDIDHATSLLAFAPALPSDVTAPAAIFVSSSGVPTSADRVLALVYDHPEDGRFIVLEYLSPTTQEEVEALATCEPTKGCQGTWELVTLDSGIRAVLVQGPASTGMFWLQEGVTIQLLGPPESFRRKGAIAIANSFS